MRSAAIVLGLVTTATAAVLPASFTVPLELGEIGWEGVVVPGEAAVEVWGASFEVGEPCGRQGSAKLDFE